MKHKIICSICGKEVITSNPKQITCSAECYKKYRTLQMRERRAEAKLLLEQQTDVDLKLWQILEIMYANNITIQEYLRAKNFYTLQYLRGNKK